MAFVPIVTDAAASSSQSGNGMGIASGVGAVGRSICLKLDVDPNISPRDTSLGTKIFTMLPNDLRTVREAKVHIANSVLKTPAPFSVFVGDYRIRDEEPVAIFSMITEPCRLLSVPVPRSALASTPRPILLSTANTSSSGSGAHCSSGKRVTFFDGDLTTSPVPRPRENGGGGGDDLDHFGPNSLPNVIQTPQPTSNGKCFDIGISPPGSGERKKKRRRRPRNKKHNKEASDDLDVDSDTSPAKKGNCSGEGITASTSRIDGNRSDIKVSPLETVQEDEETDESDSVAPNLQCKEFDFITPTIITRKRERDSSKSKNVNSSKRKKLSDSAFSSEEGSFLSPSTPEDSNGKGKVRQDTPIVAPPPRVVRNPKLFDAARNIFSALGADSGNVKMEPTKSIDTEDDLKNSSANADSLVGNGLSNQTSYSQLEPISSAEEMNVGDTIAFKVLQLDENYSPSVSSYKEGIVTEKDGANLLLKFTKNEEVVRTGKYELGEENDATGDESESECFHFSKFIEPKFVNRVANSSNLK